MIEEIDQKLKGMSKAGYVMAILCCLFVIFLTLYMGNILFGWISKADTEREEVVEALKVQGEDLEAEEVSGAAVSSGAEEGISQSGQELSEALYTAEEVERMIAQAREEASVAAREALVTELQISLEKGSSIMKALRECISDRLVLASNGKYYFLPIRKDLPHNHYVEENLNILDSGELQYMEKEQVISHKGIDVSKHQGKIDWKKVAADGIEFAIIRVGYRGYGAGGKLAEDERFDANMKGALAAGIETGVYFYSQALDEEELRQEAELVIRKLEPYDIVGPVVYDVEKAAGEGRMNSLSVEKRTQLTKLFCQLMEEAGYTPMIYHNMEMALLMLDLSQLKQYDKWFAYYNPELYYPYDYSLWQYTDKGKVAGIEGDVDLNISFGPWRK